jgi:histidine triad (HIT) family protein
MGFIVRQGLLSAEYILPMPTLFERIYQGDLPADVLYRDEEIVAFRDIHPRARTHVLIVPRKPIPTADDITPEDAPLIGRLFIVARDIARREGIAESGYRLIINCRDHGGQEVYHLHLHLLGGEPLGPMTGGR